METTIAHKLLDAEARRERRFDARGLVTFYLLTLALTLALCLQRPRRQADDGADGAEATQRET